MTFTRVQKLPTAVGQATDMGNNIALGTVMFVVNCVIESANVRRANQAAIRASFCFCLPRENHLEEPL